VTKVFFAINKKLTRPKNQIKSVGVAVFVGARVVVSGPQGQSDWLLILIKNMYFLCGRKCSLLPVLYFLNNLVFNSFTLRITDILRTQNVEGTLDDNVYCVRKIK